MENVVENFYCKVLMATSMLANRADNAPMILMGMCDDELRCFSWLRIHKDAPPSREALEGDQEVSEQVELIKSNIRNMIQAAINGAAGEEKKKTFAEISRKAAEEKKLREERMKKLHSQPIQGTVSEISEKYGISKSEVRRLRAQGGLEAFIVVRDAKIACMS